MAKKKATKKEENSLNLETILFNCRDYLRGSASLNLMMLKLRCASNVSTEELLMKRKSQDSLIPPLATKI